MSRFHSGEIVRHFKRELEAGGTRYLYRIIGEAIHSESREPMMVYQALYGECLIYVRPLTLFEGEVDREKYPEIKQRYRFEHYEG